MSNLESRTTSAVAWNVSQQFLSKGIHFLATLALAWFLVPEDFALIAMLAVFMALSTAFIDAGLGQALIQKLVVTDLELNTVFYTNLVLSILVYGLLFLSAPMIADFYAEPRILNMVRVVSLSVFFQALIVVQHAMLSRGLKFSLLFWVNIPAAALSAMISLSLAYFGYGVWALVLQIISNSLFLALFYWRLKLWSPKVQFSFRSLKELWAFAGYIVADQLVAIPFKNMYLIVLPKYFALGPVGLYYFAYRIKEAVISLIVNSVVTVSYPALATLQADSSRLKESYRKLIITTTFLTFPLTALLAVLAPVIFRAFLPEAWQDSAEYLQLMCLAALLYPLHSINLNILKVTKRPDLVLYVGFLKKATTIIIFVYTVQIGITEVLLGQIMASIINYAPNAYYSNKLIAYSLTEQIIDFLPSFILAGGTAAAIYFLQHLIPMEPLASLFLLGALGLFFYISCAHLLNLTAYNQARGLLIKLWGKRSR